jgi:sec-independent protein translocase protein TatB
MFDIAWSELLLIAIVALIFIGPKELPAVLANLGRMTAKLRRSADDFRRHFEDSMRDSGYEDLHKNIQDFRALNPATQLRASIDRAINQEGSKPASPLSQPPSIVPADQAPLQGSDPVIGVPAAPAPGLAEGSQKPVDETSKNHAAPVA